MLAVIQNQRFRTLLLAWPAKAIQYIYEAYYHSLLLISQRLTQDLNTAEDIVQATFIEIWDKYESFAKHSDRSIEYYLVTVVKKRSAKAYEEKRKAEAEHMRKVGKAERFPTELDIARFKNSVCFQLIFERFTRRERQCFEMRYMQGMHPMDIAIKLKVSDSAVERRLNRARRKLRQHQWVLS